MTVTRKVKRTFGIHKWKHLFTFGINVARKPLGRAKTTILGDSYSVDIRVSLTSSSITREVQPFPIRAHRRVTCGVILIVKGGLLDILPLAVYIFGIVNMDLVDPIGTFFILPFIVIISVE